MADSIKIFCFKFEIFWSNGLCVAKWIQVSNISEAQLLSPTPIGKLAEKIGTSNRNKKSVVFILMPSLRLWVILRVSLIRILSY